MPTRLFAAAVLLATATTLAACPSGDDGPQVDTCPAWAVGDWVTFRRTGEGGTSMVTYEVVDRVGGLVTISDGASTWTFEARGGGYLPTASVTTSGVTTTYTTATPFCPPPARGDSYESVSFIPGPWEGSGEYVTVNEMVIASTVEPVTTPVGTLRTRKVMLERTTSSSPSKVTTVTRHYAGAIGLVRTVEVGPSGATSIEELVSLSSPGLLP